MHLSGFPCTPHSNLGPGTNTNDACMLYVCGWAATARCLGYPVLTIENVDGILYLVQMLFGDLWNTDDHALLSTPMFGQDVERDRRFHVCTHKSYCTPIGPSLGAFAPRFYRRPRGSLNQFFWLHHYDCMDSRLRDVSKGELNKELQWARRRRTSHAAITGQQHLSFLRPEEVGSPDTISVRCESDPFELALNGMERGFLNGYRRKSLGNRVSAANLQNNPEKCCVAVLGDRAVSRLMTLPKSMHLVWTDASEQHGIPFSRWLGSSEALVAQGFRLHPEVQRPYLQSSFDVALAGRHHYISRQAAGNSIHTSCVGMHWLHVGLNLNINLDPIPVSLAPLVAVNHGGPENTTINIVTASGDPVDMDTGGDDDSLSCLKSLIASGFM